MLAVSGAAAMLAVGGANADPPPGTIGPLTLTPATGTDVTVPQVETTDAGCPTTVDSFNVIINGPGLSDIIVVSTDTLPEGGGKITRSFGFSLKDAAAANNTSLSAGEYDVTLRCLDGLTQDVAGTFTTAMIFDTPTTWHAFGSPTTATTTTSVTATNTSSTTPQSTSVTDTVASSTTESSSTAPSSSDSDTATPSMTTSDVGGASTTSSDEGGTTNATTPTGGLASTGAPVGVLFFAGVILLAMGLLLLVWLQRPKGHTSGRSGAAAGSRRRHAATRSRESVDDACK